MIFCQTSLFYKRVCHFTYVFYLKTVKTIPTGSVSIIDIWDLLFVSPFEKLSFVFVPLNLHLKFKPSFLITSYSKDKILKIVLPSGFKLVSH